MIVCSVCIVRYKSNSAKRYLNHYTIITPHFSTFLTRKCSFLYSFLISFMARRYRYPSQEDRLHSQDIS